MPSWCSPSGSPTRAGGCCARTDPSAGTTTARAAARFDGAGAVVRFDGATMHARDVLWSSRFRLHRRIAETFRAERRPAMMRHAMVVRDLASVHRLVVTRSRRM